MFESSAAAIAGRTDEESALARWGAAAWRLIGIGAVGFFAWRLLRDVSVVALALILAFFPAAVLWTPTRYLRRKGWSPSSAALTSMALLAAVVTGVMWVVVPAVVDNLGDLSDDLAAAGMSVRDGLVDLGADPAQVDATWASISRRFSRGDVSEDLAGGAVVAFENITGAILTLITSFFLLRDGRTIFDAVVGRLPEHRRDRVRRGATAAWGALRSYMGALAVVGVIDAVFIGLGLAILGVPLVIPLTLLVFLGSFFPLIGAFTSGLVAMVVAFASEGLTTALIVLALIITVQQLEGNLILPMVMGRTLRLHPLLVILAVTAGGIAFGIPGAFLAVPLVATTLAARRELAVDADSDLAVVAADMRTLTEAEENRNGHVGGEGDDPESTVEPDSEASEDATGR